MKISKLVILAVIVIGTVVNASAMRVLSGGFKSMTSGGSYKATWTYVIGDDYDHTYNPNDEPGSVDWEVCIDLSTANARWGSNAAAFNTLASTDYNYTYCTQSCITR